MKKTIMAIFLMLVLFCVGVYAVAPVANAGEDQIVLEDYLVTLDGSDSSDADTDEEDLTYSWTQVSGPTVELSDSTVVDPTFTPADAGDYVFELVVNDSVDTDSAQVTVTAKQVLRIKDLDIKVGSETDKNVHEDSRFISDELVYIIRDEAKPEDTVKFDIELESMLDDDIDEEDFDIEEILVTITIEDIDDGDELEEEGDEFDLGPGKDESDILVFEIPLKVDEGDYDVTILIESEDENGVIHEIEKELVLEVKKDRHNIMIYKFSLNPTSLKCSRAATLKTEIMNLGRNEEDDVRLEIMSEDLGINSVSSPDYDLSEDWDDDDNTYEKILTLTIPEDFEAGVYAITATSFYDDKESETKTIELFVEDCVAEVVEEEPEEEEEDFVIDIVDEIDIPDDIVPAEPIEEEEVSFTKSSQFYTLMVIVIILVIGLIIFLVGAFVIKASKKEE